MPTYHEVLTTDLSGLTTAAGKWEEMATRFKTLEERYEKDVHGISLGESWIGLSAQAANDRFTITLKELQGAQKEAKAVAGVLRDAHTQLTDLRNRVKAIRDDAVKAGMRVSDQGTVAFDTAQLTQSERTTFAHDPDFQQTARTQANEWAEKLVQAVKAVTDADDGIRVALDAAVLDSDPIDGTFNGFNRNPQDSPYPSLEEAGKAANMPKDRKDIPAWWQSLGPVTRGILLKETGDELRSAGIMDPRYQWHSADPGSGRFDAEEPTPEDLWFHARALAIATAGDAIGETGASRNMLHYLRGTGETLDLDVDRILADDSDFRSKIENKHVGTNQDAWRQQALNEFHEAGGDRTVVVPVESRTRHTNLQSDEWFHAVGAHAQNVSGFVTVTPDAHGGAPKVSLDYQVNVWDRYNWDPGKSTPFADGLINISDGDMGRLHKVGFAQEFDMQGSSSTYHHDLNSSTPPTTTPEDQGREGTRGDVSRGEEKNR
ncbi:MULTISPECIES: hypothetical protein [Streptomyces]|uniref:Uncharacterized protein n=1 Tax=Streptomyces venezuelae TaxID=54571 RepID=A0A5P2AX67_STRVZ|nr:hypothetical protein [Streptomyces venezuelae]QES22357.1 hypothetical protein DEJ46_27360 [Streptomyces venezuelae]